MVTPPSLRSSSTARLISWDTNWQCIDGHLLSLIRRVAMWIKSTRPNENHVCPTFEFCYYFLHFDFSRNPLNLGLMGAQPEAMTWGMLLASYLCIDKTIYVYEMI